MGKSNIERSISSGIKENLHGIVINEVWQAWDKICQRKKQQDPDQLMVTVEIKTDKHLAGLTHINFVEHEKKFDIRTHTAQDTTIKIICLDGLEAMLLAPEAQTLYERIRTNGQSV